MGKSTIIHNNNSLSRDAKILPETPRISETICKKVIKTEVSMGYVIENKNIGYSTLNIDDQNRKESYRRINIEMGVK